MMICLCTETVEGLLVIAMVPVADKFGWNALIAMTRQDVLHTVVTTGTAGAITIVVTVSMSRSRATRLLL